MRRAWIAVIAVACMATPGAALAHGGDGSQFGGEKNRSKACKALRAQMGPQLFRETYGSNHNKRNALGKCVSKHRHPFRQLIAQAISDCKAQLGVSRVRHFEGDDDHPRGDDRKADRAAFRQCVRDRLAVLLAERLAAIEAAAKSCDTERTADPVAFAEKYGRGEKKRHAFFRCVVQTFRANQAAA